MFRSNNNDNNNNNVCSEGYYGPVCGLCDDGYGRLGSECAKCPSKIESDFIVSFLIIISILGCIAFVYYTLSSSSSNLIKFDIVRLKISITHLQIIGFICSFSSDWPESLIKIFGIPSSIATISSTTNNIAIDCSAPISLYSHSILIMFLPLILSFSVILGCYLCNNIDKNQSIEGTMALLYIAHPGIIEGLFKNIDCFQVGTKLLAVSDMNIDCSSSSFIILQVISYLYLIFYGIGGLIFVYYKKLSFPFLSNGYKKNMYFWDIIITFRKIILVIISVYASSPVQLLFGSWVLMISLILSYYYDPYENIQHKNLEIVSIITLFITVTTGMLFYSKSIQSSDSIILVTVILILLNFIVVLVILFSYRGGIGRVARGNGFLQMESLNEKLLNVN